MGREAMKPQKKKTRSVRDFFTPASQGARAESTSATPQPAVDTEAAGPQTPLFTGSDAPGIVRDKLLANKNTISATIPCPTTRPTSTSSQAPTQSQSLQNPANPGASKRVVSNGQQVVLNSDSDTDSLPDLDFGDAPAAKSSLATHTKRPRLALDDGKDVLRKPPKKTNNAKRPLSLLVETARENVQLEQEIIEGKAELDRIVEAPAKVDIAVDEKILDQVVSDDEDPDKAHRLYLAMQRTNAMHLDTAFYFFNMVPESLHAHVAFPRDSLPNHRWASVFEDASTRDEAFLTGFAQQIFRIRKLPQELASWMIEQICMGRNESLNFKYLDLLESHNQYLPDLLNRDRLDAIFKAIGAEVKGLNSKDSVNPLFVSHSGDRPAVPNSLKSILRLLERVAPWLHTKTKCHALHILCHVSMDEGVLADAGILQCVQDAIEALICHFTDERKLTTGPSDLVHKLLARIKHPILQRNLVRAFPARSPLTAYFQRHLALSFLLHPTVVDVPLADAKILTLIHTHLNTSTHYRIRKDTDYNLLAAQITLLDKAIGPGPLSVPYQPLLSPAPSQAGSSPLTAPFPESSEVKHFNQAVDDLAKHVKMLGNSIVEAGAAVDLAILDAKDCSERLCARLEHAVRIGGKKSDNVFGEEDESRQMKVSRFFVKREKGEVAKQSRNVKGIFDEEEDDDDDDDDDDDEKK